MFDCKNSALQGYIRERINDEPSRIDRKRKQNKGILKELKNFSNKFDHSLNLGFKK